MIFLPLSVNFSNIFFHLTKTSDAITYPKKILLLLYCHCQLNSAFPLFSSPSIIYLYSMYVNVAFPLRIAPLTYKVPAGAPASLVGRIVRAPLMGRSIYGLVMSTCSETEMPEMTIKKEIREIQAFYQSVMSSQAIAFIQWLADYYLTPVGTALRSCFFEKIAAIVTKKAEDQAEGTLSPEVLRPVTIQC